MIMDVCNKAKTIISTNMLTEIKKREPSLLNNMGTNSVQEHNNFAFVESLDAKGQGPRQLFTSIAAPVSPPEALASAAPPGDPLTSDRNPKPASVESLHRLYRGCLGDPAWTLNLNPRPLRWGSQLASLPLLRATLLSQLLDLTSLGTQRPGFRTVTFLKPAVKKKFL